MKLDRRTFLKASSAFLAFLGVRKAEAVTAEPSDVVSPININHLKPTEFRFWKDAETGETHTTALMPLNYVDVDGDVILAEGADFERFYYHPVVRADPIGIMSSFGQDMPPVVGVVKNCVKVKDGICFGIKFCHSVFAELGWLKRGSFTLGYSFIASESSAPTWAEKRKYGRDCKRVYRKWELMELHLVLLPGIPA